MLYNNVSVSYMYDSIRKPCDICAVDMQWHVRPYVKCVCGATIYVCQTCVSYGSVTYINGVRPICKECKRDKQIGICLT